MRSFFSPTGAPTWLTQVLNSIRAALTDIWPAPLRLKDYATANLPTAADFVQGMAYNSTTLRVTYSNGSAWIDLMPFTAGAALTKVDDTNVTATLGGSPASALLAATSITLGWTGQLAVGRGGTGIASYAVGDLIYASASTTLAKLADVATGNVLISGGVTTAPAWGKVGISTHVSGLATGIATFLGTPSSANLAAALTDETGTGACVFAGSPTFTGTAVFAALTATGATVTGSVTVTGSGGDFSVVSRGAGVTWSIYNSAGTLFYFNPTDGNAFSIALGGVFATLGSFRTVAKTVSGLVAAGTAGSGTRDFVSDATATTFASIVAGGGANGVPVYSDGTNWRIG